MITPDVLLPLWEAHRDAIHHPVRTFELAGRTFDDRPYQLGVINLSRDSTYRESIAHDVPAALYRARRMTVEGAVMIDIGAESTGTNADIVDVDAQLASLLPVLDALLAEGLLVSIETYLTDVAVAALEAGAQVINLTGRVDDPALYEAIARHDARLILCYTPGETARSKDELPSADVLIDEQLAFFAERLELATSSGVERIWIDPGFGFALNLPDVLKPVVVKGRAALLRAGPELRGGLARDAGQVIAQDVDFGGALLVAEQDDGVGNALAHGIICQVQ